MRAKHLLIVAAVLIAAFTQLQAQPAVATINVDALTNLAKTGGGEAGGALFLPDGNIIALWKGRPLIIDSKSGEIIRNLDALPSGFAAAPKLSPDGTKLITRITESQMAIWDVPSGKIIKQFNYQIGWFCFSPDGTKLYVTLPNLIDNLGHLVIFDMATLQEIERMSYPKLNRADLIDISPDGQTLAVLVGKKKDGQTDNKINQIILINLNDKINYTVVETAEPYFMSIQFSPDGKKIASLYDNGDYIYIYI
ncbi:MAG: WD40 repeat domain-containing protein [bacterium]